MKPAIIIGILLIIVGFVGFSLGGFSFTHEKKDIDAGPDSDRSRTEKDSADPARFKRYCFNRWYRTRSRRSTKQIDFVGRGYLRALGGAAHIVA
jgi:hypothetical protein